MAGPGFLLALFIICGLCSFGESGCPTGWFSRYGSCYYFSRDQNLNSWQDARIKCQAMQADLLDINTAQERDWVIQVVRKLIQYNARQKTHYYNWWIGLNAQADGKTWQNANGTKANVALLTSVWQAGHSSPSSKAQCVHINRVQLFVDYCSKQYQAICERPQNLPLTCDDGWKQYGGMCYLRVGKLETFADASKLCNMKGASLPVVPDDDTQKSINDLAKSYGAYTWVGARSEQKTKTSYTWRYSNGSLLSVWGKTYWYKTQPKIAPTRYNNTCVVVNYHLPNYKQSWVIHSCTSKSLALCQMPEGVCPDGWLQYGQTCYQFNSDVLAFNQAASYCRKLGGALYRPVSKNVHTFISSYLREQRKLGVQSIWLGISDVVNKTVWNYANGGAINQYTNWIKNGGKHVVNRKSCAFMVTSNPRGWWLTTTNCNLPKSYICQIPSNQPLKAITPPPYVYHCDKGWKNSGKHCFYFFQSGGRNFESARLWCDARASHLAVIPDQDTQDFIQESINKKGAYWIGLYDGDTENAFSWMDNGQTPMNYTNWKKGQPNNYNGVENCVMIFGSGSLIGQWNDDSCSKKYYFICEKEAKYVPNTYTVPTSPPFGVKCGPFWEEDPNSDFCYQFSDKQKIWADAQATCKSYGGDLLSVTSSIEQAYVSGRIKGMKSHLLWIGANDMKKERGFSWTDRSPFSYVNWQPGEPNDYNHNEDCGAMFTDSGLWNDLTCTRRQGYICKKVGKTTATSPKPTTTPATLPSNMVWGCPLLWKGYRGSCYLYVPDKLSQSDAISNCRVQGGDLASIAGPPENKFLQSLLPNAPKNKDSLVWIGLNDQAIESDFVWSDGESVSYTNWAGGNPNDKKGTQDCVAFLSKVGGWVDLNCEDTRPSVCRQPKSQQPKQTVATGCEKYPGSLGYRGSCYLYVNTPIKKWVSAEKACKKKNGHLATIYDNHVQAFLSAEITLEGDHFWIGLSDMKSPGNYIWSSNNRVGFTAWIETHSGNERKTCVVMQAQRPIGLWINANCTDNHGYICEYPRVGYTNPPVTTTIQSSLPCPAGWTAFQDLCYKAFITDKATQQTWREAYDTCTTQGGDLASIHNSSLEDFFTGTLLNKQSGNFWIGLNDRDTERSHEWTDDSPFDYSNWASGEPNDWNHQEDCVQYSVNDNRWYDDNCYLAHNFICQTQRGQTVPTTITPGTAVTSTHECGNSSWSFYNGYCYYLSPKSGPNGWMNYYDAERLCNTIGAHLASIHSAEENGFLTSLMNKHNSVMFYIGLNDLDLGGYAWTDGTAVNFLSWSPNEPNDDYGGERCTQIFSNRGTWTDVQCGMINAYVCKKKGTDTFPITQPPLVVQSGGCPQGFVAAQGSSKCYYLGAATDKTKRLNYTDARAACRAMGSDVEIASINSYIEQLTITTLLKGKPWQFWIGLNDIRKNGLFMWQDNSEVTYTNWGRGEPNENLANKRDRQDCVLVVPKKKTAGGFWVDAPCSFKKGYICHTQRSQALPNPTPDTTGCTSGYQRYGGSCYSLKTTRKNWQNAQAQCQQEGGNLVTISDVYEQAYVSLMVKTRTVFSWIGLSDQSSAGNYGWVNKWPVTFTYWAYNEPSKRDGEGCVAMKLNNRWDDVMCNSTFNFICEVVVSSNKPTTPSTVGGTCRKGWTAYKGRCFLDFSERSVRWSMANTMCKRRRADLVSLHSKDEEKFFSSIIKFPTSDIWLGLTRARNGGYIYTDGSPVDYLNWDKNEPSDETNMQQNCVAKVNFTSKWDDLTCGLNKGFACVKVMSYSTPKNNIHRVTPNPVTQGPTKKPVTQGPFTQRPFTQGPVTQGPVTQGPIINGPITQGPFTNRPYTQGPFTQSPINRNTPAPYQSGPGKSPSSGLSDGAVAGIVISSLFLVVGGLIAFVILSRKYEWTFTGIRRPLGFVNALYKSEEETVTVQQHD